MGVDLCQKFVLKPYLAFFNAVSVLSEHMTWSHKLVQFHSRQQSTFPGQNALLHAMQLLNPPGK